MNKRTFVAIAFALIFIVCYNKVYIIGHSFKVDLFLAVLIISFLFCYKISNYLADFKINKSASRIDIVFLMLFFILLFIPMSQINQKEISTKEHRVLAKWKPFYEDGKLNLTFGRDFDNFFSDRFYKRFLTIKTYINLQRLNKTFRFKFIIADLQTKYFTINSQFNNYIKILSDEELHNDVQNILKFNKFLNDNDIELYIFVIPSNFTIYEEFIPSYINKSNLNRHTAALQLKDALKDTGINYYYIYDDYIKAKDAADMIYYKTDGHMTDFGIWIAYKAIIQEIAKKYKDLKKPVELKNFSYTETPYVNMSYGTDENSLGYLLYSSLNNKKYLDRTYKHYQVDVSKFENIGGLTQDILVNNNNEKYNLFLMGKS